MFRPETLLIEMRFIIKKTLSNFLLVYMMPQITIKKFLLFLCAKYKDGANKIYETKKYMKQKNV